MISESSVVPFQLFAFNKAELPSFNRLPDLIELRKLRKLVQGSMLAKLNKGDIKKEKEATSRGGEAERTEERDHDEEEYVCCM